MDEKTYKVMGRAGALNITIGILSIIAGVTAGVLMIVSGAKLFASKSRIIF